MNQKFLDKFKGKAQKIPKYGLNDLFVIESNIDEIKQSKKNFKKTNLYDLIAINSKQDSKDTNTTINFKLNNLKSIKNENTLVGLKNHQNISLQLQKLNIEKYTNKSVQNESDNSKYVIKLPKIGKENQKNLNCSTNSIQRNLARSKQKYKINSTHYQIHKQQNEKMNLLEKFFPKKNPQKIPKTEEPISLRPNSSEISENLNSSISKNSGYRRQLTLHY